MLFSDKEEGGTETDVEVVNRDLKLINIFEALFFSCDEWHCVIHVINLIK